MRSRMIEWRVATSLPCWRVIGMRGVVVLLDRVDGRDRQVARLVDLPHLAAIRSGSWSTTELAGALAVARSRAIAEHRDSAVTAIDLAVNRLKRGSGPVLVRRAHATEGIRRIRRR
jgi:hypothetical protein